MNSLRGLKITNHRIMLTTCNKVLRDCKVSEALRTVGLSPNPILVRLNTVVSRDKVQESNPI